MSEEQLGDAVLSGIEQVTGEIDEEIVTAERRLDELRLQRLGLEAIRARLAGRGRADAQESPRLITPVPAPVFAPVPTAAPPPATRSVTDLVHEALEKAGRQGASLEQVRHEVNRGGHSLDSEQVRSAITYLRRKGLSERVERGVWRLIAAAVVPTNTVSPTTDAGPTVLDPAIKEGGDASGTDLVRDHDSASSARALHRDLDLGAPIRG